mmetsp:Transcript_19541/g.50097  ORF Transcript_19541/g.50097 Transcript_19541/m.50097 type:complete len:230 (+) Transcript_19541:1249-1938(+)
MYSVFSRRSMAPKDSTCTSCKRFAASSASPSSSFILASISVSRAFSTSTKIFPSVTSFNVPINSNFVSLSSSSNQLITKWTMSVVARFNWPRFLGKSTMCSFNLDQSLTSKYVWQILHNNFEVDLPSQACRHFFSKAIISSTASSTRPACFMVSTRAMTSSASLLKSSVAFGSLAIFPKTGFNSCAMAPTRRLANHPPDAEWPRLLTAAPPPPGPALLNLGAGPAGSAT